MVLSAFETFREEARVEGLEKGIERGVEKVATNMLKKGMKSEEVIELTDLSQKQVETILHKIDSKSKH